MPTASSDIEALAAAAFATHVGIVELEALVEAFTNEIELSAIEVDEALGIDDDLDAVAVEDRVFRSRLVYEFERVGQHGTTGSTYPQPYTDALAAPFQGAAYMIGCGAGHADSHRNLLRLCLVQAFLLAVVTHRRLDGVLGQHRAVDLYQWQSQLFGKLRVLDGFRLFQRLALHPLGRQRAGRDGRAATVGLGLGVFDHALLVDLDLQTHHVTASRSADHAGTDGRILGVELADVTGVFVVVDDLVTVCHGAILVDSDYAAWCLSGPPTRPWRGLRPPWTYPRKEKVNAA